VGRPRIRPEKSAIERQKIAQRSRDYLRKNPDWRWSAALRNRGVTPEDYYAQLAKQEGLCAICGTNTPGISGHTKQPIKKFHYDHDHKTGSHRGLLCNRCNIGIGIFGEDVITMSRAVDYLRGWAMGKP
jgi:hypothetical protein